MSRFYKIMVVVLAALLGRSVTVFAMVGQDQKSSQTPSHLLVTFKSPYSRLLERTLPGIAASAMQVRDKATLDAFLATHHIQNLEPLHRELVDRKRRTGKSATELAEEIRAQFPERSRRIHSILGVPDLSRTYVVSPDVPSPMELDQLAQTLRRDPNVESVQAEQIYQIQFTPNDPYYSSVGSWGQTYDDLYGLKKLSTSGAWDIDRGTGVLVAVVDTGIDYTHPDLAANVWTNPVDGSHGYNFVTNTNDPKDDHGHGSHVAGTIAAIGNNNLGIIGVAPQAKVMGVKGLDSFGSGTNTNLAQAIVWATNHGAQVINMSWGYQGPADPTLTSALQYAHSLGVVLVAAAGNSTIDASLFFPASSPYVITVSAFDWNDQKASFSDYGNKIDVAAPGVNILSLQAAGTALGPVVSPGYIYISGTSMATPHVVGLAALILSEHPAYTNEQVRQVLRLSADDVDTPGFDIRSGYGRINALHAMQLPALGPPDTTPPIVNFTSPANGATVSGMVTLLGTASDSGGVVQVAISVDGVAMGVAAGTSSWSYTLDTTLLYNSTHTLTAQAMDTAFNSGSASIGVTVSNPGQAAYNATYQAPMCATVGSVCDSGNLLNGRDSITGGPEPHAPNTIKNSCADGMSGSYHNDESNDRLRISAVDGTNFMPGKTAKIQATVWAYAGFTSDFLDFYYTPNADAPNWIYLTTLHPSAPGSQVLTTTFTVLGGSLQAVRANFRSGGSAAACSNGPFDDHDDLIFAVGASTDTQPPTTPSGLVISSVTATTLSLAWSPSTDDIGIQGYHVDVSTTSSFNAFIPGYANADVGNVTQKLITGLAPGTTYYMRLRAYDLALNVSSNSATASARTIGDTTPPSAPTNLFFFLISSSSLGLDWSAATDNVGVTGYRLDVSTNAGFFGFVNGYANLDLGNQTFSNMTGLLPQTFYYVRLRAYDAAGNVSSNSLVTGATTLPPPDTIPPSVSISSPTNGAQLSGVVTISGTASDNVAVTQILIQIDEAPWIVAAGTTFWSYSLDTTQLVNGNHVLSALARDFAGNLSMASISFASFNTGLAAYDPVLKVPVCSTPGSVCNSGGLLNGRASISGGPEPNQPNALQNSCSDGPSGNYHTDESNDRLKISTVDGSTLRPGVQVKVEATVWAFQIFASDALDLYYTATASSPTWTYLGTITPTAAGKQVLSSTYTLPTGALQAVRANYRFGGAPSPCSSGIYDDHDDLAFAVAVDTTPLPPSDLIVQSMLTIPAIVQPGAVMSIVTKVVNQGLGPNTSNYVLDLYQDLASSPTISSPGIALKPGETGTWIVPRPAPVRLGWHALQAVADDLNQIPESDETNNARTIYFTVAASTIASTDTYLSDLPWVSVSSGVPPVQRDVNLQGNKILLNGVAYPKGLGVASHTDIVFAIPAGQQCAFITTVGVDDAAGPTGSVSFWSDLDGSGIFYSGLMTSAQPAQTVAADVTGGQLMHLRVDAGSDGSANHDADWANARLHCNLIPDKIPPVISSVTVTNITGSSATFTWSTDELSDSSIYYGLTTGYGFTVSDYQSRTSHSIILTGLQPATTYHYLAASDDPFNNNGLSNDLTFRTLDTLPPSTAQNPTLSQATTSTLLLSWGAATDNVGVAGYRLDVSTKITFDVMSGNYNNQDVGLTTSTVITDLFPNTTYYARLRTYDTSGNFSPNSHLAIGITLPVNLPPTIVSSATANPNPLFGTSTTLTVKAADDSGEASLTYTWLSSGPAPVFFSSNGTNAAKTSIAVFSHSGAYLLNVTIQDAIGLSTSSAVSVTVADTLSSLSLRPTTVTLTSGSTQQFTITGTNQFGSSIAVSSVTWWASTGTISATGLYTAAYSNQPVLITAASGGFLANATVTIINPPPPLIGTPFVTSVISGNLRNNFTGWVGMSVQVGTSPLVVSTVGRFYLAGNNQPHTLKWVLALTGKDVPGGSVTFTPTGVSGQFSYATLASSITLLPNTLYYLVSHEQAGGDLWYDLNTQLTSTADGSLHGGIWSSDTTPPSWGPTGASNNTYVPVDFRYQNAAAQAQVQVQAQNLAAGAITSIMSVRVYPNPWRSDRAYAPYMYFDQIPAGSTVKIFTIAAQHVATVTADSNGKATWDLQNMSGDKVASGIYFFLVTDPEGNQTRGKLAIIR